jgi:putative transposase
MVFKLVESAQARWRAVNAPHLVALQESLRRIADKKQQAERLRARDAGLTRSAADAATRSLIAC